MWGKHQMALSHILARLQPPLGKGLGYFSFCFFIYKMGSRLLPTRAGVRVEGGKMCRPG